MTAEFTVGLRSNNKPLCLPYPMEFHQLIAGETGSGKSSLLQAQVYALSGRAEMAFVAIDPKCVEFGPWVDRLSVFAQEMHEIDQAIGNVLQLVGYRKRILAQHGLRTWTPALGPPLAVFVDEMAELGGMDANHLLDALTNGSERDRSSAVRDARTSMQFRVAMLASIARQARFVGVTLVCATQYPSAEVIDQQVRTQLGVVSMLRVSRDEQIRVILGGSETPAVTVNSIPKSERGGLWMVGLPGEPQPIRARAAFVTDTHIAERVEATRHLRIPPEVLFPWTAETAVEGPA